MNLEQMGVMRLIGVRKQRLADDFPAQVRARLEKRLAKLSPKPLDISAEDDWFVALYVSWLAMYEEWESSR
jgi:hypothetical protein